MDQTALLYIMTGAVVVSAIAIVIQMLILFGMYKVSKGIQDQVTKLTPRVEALVDTAQRTVEQSKQQILDITTKANEILASTKTQLGRVEEVLTEATGRAKAQMDRVELVLDDTVSRVQETVAVLHNGVMRPIREASGIASGVRATLQHLMGGRRPSVAQATADEEMFI